MRERGGSVRQTMNEKSIVFGEVLSGIELHFRPNHAIVPEIRSSGPLFVRELEDQVRELRPDVQHLLVVLLAAEAADEAQGLRRGVGEVRQILAPAVRDLRRGEADEQHRLRRPRRPLELHRGLLE